MKRIKLAHEFKRDMKKLKKRGKDLSKLDKVVQSLIKSKKLDSKYREHKLQGNYINKLECHLEPDWLLIYEIDDAYVTLYRTGSHSDLFKM